MQCEINGNSNSQSQKGFPLLHYSTTPLLH
jgi:hypothetical protein